MAENLVDKNSADKEEKIKTNLYLSTEIYLDFKMLCDARGVTVSEALDEVLLDITNKFSSDIKRLKEIKANIKTKTAG